MEKLELKNISKHFDDEDNLYTDYSISFQKGKLYAIMGPSGVGKSTLLNLIAGLDVPDSGMVSADEFVVTQMNEDERAEFRLNHIGFIFQNYYLNPYISVLENVMVPMLPNRLVQRGERREKAIKLLKDYGMDKYEKKKPYKLSGGEQQRVAIARALVNDPDIILADEPTGNLDKKNEEKVLVELKKLAEKGKLVIVVSHSEKVREYADEVVEFGK